MERTTQNGQTSVTPKVDSGPAATDGTHVTITNDGTTHDQTNIDDGQVTYNSDKSNDQRVSGRWPVAADQHVRQLTETAEDQRQQIENTRANHRNFNRVMTLLFTLVAGLLITYGLYHSWFGAWGPAIGPYSFVITVTGDFFLTLYALLRHY